MAAGRVKYRIRPPGCDVEARYSWRYGDDGAAPVKPKREYADPMLIKEGEGWRDVGSFEILGGEYHVEAMKGVPIGKLRCTAVAKQTTVAELLNRIILKSDVEVGDGIIHRNVTYPFLLEARKYVITKVVGEGRLQLYTVPEQQDPSDLEVYLNQLIEAAPCPTNPSDVTFTLHESHLLGGMPVDEVIKFAPEAFARYVHRIATGLDPILGRVGHHAVGVLEKFVASCSDKTSFKPWKDVWISRLNKSVTVYKRAEAKTSYPAYRAEAVLQGTLEDFITMLEAMADVGGVVQKMLTPECESQGIHIEDAVARLVHKTDKIGPWPMKKREYLCISLLGWTKDHALYFPQVSIEDPKYPVASGSCRAIFHEVGFACVPLGGGKIRVVQMIHADPLGIPRAALDIAMADYTNNLGKMQELLDTKQKWYKPHVVR